MPTSEWKNATSCGIAVIGMRLATTAPPPPPMARPTTTSAQPMKPEGGETNSVVTMAMPMPIMP
jgi:hypothetical protein